MHMRSWISPTHAKWMAYRCKAYLVVSDVKSLPTNKPMHTLFVPVTWALPAVFGSPIFNCHPTTDGSLRIIGNADLPSGTAYLFVSFGDIPGGSLADTLNAGLPLPCQYRAYLSGTSLYSRLSTFQVQLFTNGQATYSGERCA